MAVTRGECDWETPHYVFQLRRFPCSLIHNSVSLESSSPLFNSFHVILLYINKYPLQSHSGPPSNLLLIFGEAVMLIPVSDIGSGRSVPLPLSPTTSVDVYVSPLFYEKFSLKCWFMNTSPAGWWEPTSSASLEQASGTPGRTSEPRQGFCDTLMQTFNNDRKPSNEPLPLRGGVTLTGPGVEIICIDCVTLLLQRANPWELTSVPELWSFLTTLLKCRQEWSIWLRLGPCGGRSTSYLPL